MILNDYNQCLCDKFLSPQSGSHRSTPASEHSDHSDSEIISSHAESDAEVTRGHSYEVTRGHKTQTRDYLLSFAAKNTKFLNQSDSHEGLFRVNVDFHWKENSWDTQIIILDFIRLQKLSVMESRPGSKTFRIAVNGPSGAWD